MIHNAKRFINEMVLSTKKKNSCSLAQGQPFQQISLRVTANKQTNKWKGKHFFLPVAIKRSTPNLSAVSATHQLKTGADL